MPTLSAPQLRDLGRRILEGAEVPPEQAAIVADELAQANLVGHDSHGVMRLMQYVDYIRQGFIRPQASVEILDDRPACAIIDGHFQLGQVIARRALEVGLRKAKEGGVATVLVRNCNHVGRLGSYSRAAALEGCASVMAVNAPGPGGVAPFGGIDRRLGTNPLSMAAPRGQSPLVLDMTTSASAEGKLRVAYQKGEHVPEGWIIDAEGRPTTDPATFYAEPGGALLPLGGPLGFKGFGLSVMIDVLAGILSQSGVCRTDLPRGANGVWMQFLNVAALIEPREYDALIERYVAYLKSSRRQEGVEEILLPGEIEERREAERRRTGVSLPDETWRQISRLAADLGVSLEGLAETSETG